MGIKSYVYAGQGINLEDNLDSASFDSQDNSGIYSVYNSGNVSTRLLNVSPLSLSQPLDSSFSLTSTATYSSPVGFEMYTHDSGNIVISYNVNGLVNLTSERPSATSSINITSVPTTVEDSGSNQVIDSQVSSLSPTDSYVEPGTTFTASSSSDLGPEARINALINKYPPLPLLFQPNLSSYGSSGNSTANDTQLNNPSIDRSDSKKKLEELLSFENIKSNPRLRTYLEHLKSKQDLKDGIVLYGGSWEDLTFAQEALREILPQYGIDTQVNISGNITKTTNYGVQIKLNRFVKKYSPNPNNAPYDSSDIVEATFAPGKSDQVDSDIVEATFAPKKSAPAKSEYEYEQYKPAPRLLYATPREDTSLPEPKPLSLETLFDLKPETLENSRLVDRFTDLSGLDYTQGQQVILYGAPFSDLMTARSLVQETLGRFGQNSAQVVVKADKRFLEDEDLTDNDKAYFVNLTELLTVSTN